MAKSSGGSQQNLPNNGISQHCRGKLALPSLHSKSSSQPGGPVDGCFSKMSFLWVSLCVSKLSAVSNVLPRITSKDSGFWLKTSPTQKEKEGEV